MSMGTDELDLSRYPVNGWGFTVLPCVALTPSTIRSWMIGFEVTIGLSEVGVPTTSGVIESYSDTKIKLRVGTKTKQYAYNPLDIQLKCYQFERKILFSNVSEVSEGVEK